MLFRSLKEGHLLQYGPTLDVFRRPNSLDVALAFSDPPLNVVTAHQHETTWQLNHGPSVALPQINTSHKSVTLGIRAASLRVEEKSGDIAISGQVQLAEISGTDTFVHFHCALGEWVMQKTGVHFFELGSQLMFYFDPSEIYSFDPDGQLLSAPLSFQIRGA